MRYTYSPRPDYSADGVVPAKIFPDPKSSIGTGYGESKWVASQVLLRARERTPLRPVVARMGQLCGNRETGAWNAWEWFPSIVRSAKTTGCLPELEGVSLLFWISSLSSCNLDRDRNFHGSLLMSQLLRWQTCGKQPNAHR